MDMITFSKNLRILIESHGMTAQRFGIEVGIPSATVSRYLSGDRSPKFEYILRIAEFFNVSIDWLFGATSEDFDSLPSEMREVASLYSMASPDDRRVVQAVLNKYRKD